MQSLAKRKFKDNKIELDVVRKKRNFTTQTDYLECTLKRKMQFIVNEQ